MYALGCFVHNRSMNNEHATTVIIIVLFHSLKLFWIDNEVCDKLCEKCTFDGSILVRAELVAAIQWFVIDFESRFSELSLELEKKSTIKSEPKQSQTGNVSTYVSKSRFFFK